MMLISASFRCHCFASQGCRPFGANLLLLQPGVAAAAVQYNRLMGTLSSWPAQAVMVLLQLVNNICVLCLLRESGNKQPFFEQQQ
jgi:hypothetical protein